MYCTKHGLANMTHTRDMCPKCCDDQFERRRPAHILLVSKTQGMRFNKVFIGDVISVHMLGTNAEIAARHAELQSIHKC